MIKMIISEDSWLLKQELSKITAGYDMVTDCDPLSLAEKTSVVGTLFGTEVAICRLDRLPTGEVASIIKKQLSAKGRDVVFTLELPVKDTLKNPVIKLMKEQKLVTLLRAYNPEQLERLVKETIPEATRAQVQLLGQCGEGLPIGIFLDRLTQLRYSKLSKEAFTELFPKMDERSTFSLPSLVSAGREKEAYSLVTRALQQGEEPLMLIGILQRAYRIAFKASEGNRSLSFREMGMNEYTSRGIPELSKEEALQKFHSCSRANELIRNGRDPESVVLFLLGELLTR